MDTSSTMLDFLDHIKLIKHSRPDMQKEKSTEYFSNKYFI